MEQNQTPKYATLFYEVKEQLGISWHDYLLLDMVYHLSARTGYCYKSTGFIARDLELDRTTVNRMVTRLQLLGLIERYKRTFRVTDRYINAQSVSDAKRLTYVPKRGKMPKTDAKRPTSDAKRPPEQGVRIKENNNKEPDADLNGSGYKKYLDQRKQLGL